MNDLRETAKELAKEMQCNCNLDSWQPEPDTDHSWVCRIHKAAIAKNKELQNGQSENSGRGPN